MKAKLTPREKLKVAIMVYSRAVAEAATAPPAYQESASECVDDMWVALDRALAAYTRAIRQEARKGK